MSEQDKIQVPDTNDELLASKIFIIREQKVMLDRDLAELYGSFRDECLNAHWFLSLEDAKEKIAAWREEYNTFRPHSYFGEYDPGNVHRKAGQNSRIFYFRRLLSTGRGHLHHALI